MATQYTSLLGLALPVTGELSGTWGDTVNDSITSLLDTAVAGTTTLNTDSDVTLSTTTGVANQARQAIILWTANGTTTRNITAPAQSKIYTVINASAGTQSIVFRGAGPTAGVTIVKGESALVAWNGSDFIKISNTGGAASFTNVTVSGTTTLSGLTASTALALNASKEVVSVTNTGTGNNVLSASPTLTGTVAGASLQLSSLTSGRVTYAGASGLLQDSANLTFDGTTLTANALTVTNAVTLSAATANGVMYANGSKVLTTGSALTFNGTNTFTVIPATGVAYSRTESTQYSTWLQAGAGNANVFWEFSAGTPVRWVDTSAGELMRLTSTGLGIGTSSPNAKLNVNGTSNLNGVQISTDGTYAAPYVTVGFSGLTNGKTRIFGTTNDSDNLYLAAGTGRGINFWVNGSSANAMLLDSSGNLGIGTSSPGASTKLNVAGRGLFTGGAADPSDSTASGVAINYNGTTGFVGAIQTGVAVKPLHIYGNVLTFGVSPTSEAMRIDSSGNLGLGVTPSAWGSSIKALQVGSLSALWQTSTYSIFSNNVYQDSGGNKYLANGLAAEYAINAGTHAWFTAPSGTAGSAISFTQAMTLDASGNLGIGTSSPTRKLTVYGAGTDNLPVRVESAASDCFVDLKASGTTAYAVRVGATGDALLLYAGGDERARINSSGNLGLGVTPSAWDTSIFRSIQIGTGAGSASLSGRADGAKDMVLGSNVYYGSGNFRYIGTGTATVYRTDGATHAWSYAASGTAGNAITFTQAMTLDASGNLLIAKTALSGTTVGFQFKSTGEMNSGMAASTNSDTTLSVYSTGASAYRFYVGLGGTVYATSTTISAISDIRYKENVRDLNVGLAEVMALKPRLYDWKEGKGANIKNARGFIAQEFEQVFPDLIDEWKDPAPEGEDPYKSVRQDLIPVLVKAIQEQQAIIETLTARVAALESK